jgi:E3 ubiquitin-protein ligase MARCH6
MSDVRNTTFPDWRVKFERVKADGFSDLSAFWVFRKILCPIVCTLLTWLCIPYMFAKGVFPLLGYSMRANSSAYHFSWFGYLVFSVLWYFVKKLHTWLTRLHDRIKDDRYLIGTTLCNYGEDGR